MPSASDTQPKSGFGVRLLTLFFGSIVVLAGVTASHASGGWPPAGVFLSVGLLLLFLFGATRLLEESDMKAKEVRLPVK